LNDEYLHKLLISKQSTIVTTQFSLKQDET